MKTKMTFIILSLLFYQIQILSCCKDKNNIETPDDNIETPDDSSQATQVSSTSTAANYIESRMNDDNDKLYVYRNFGDGRNSFTQKAWMGNIPPSSMNEQAAGFAETGIAAEFNVVPAAWGGYMILCGILKAGESSPENNFGDVDAGFNLTGATKLIFHARGDAGGEVIEFILAGLEGKYPDSAPRISRKVTLTKEWQQYEIDLSNKNLSRIACGFGWVANYQDNSDKSKIKFYMDEIYYKFGTNRKPPVLLKSYDDRPQGSDDAIINAVAYLYDNAVAAMALSYAGKHEHARQIADAIVFAANSDRYYSDNRLRNAYMNGDIQSFPGWMSGKNQPFARLFNFCSPQTSLWVEDVFSNSSATGNMAWAIMALCEVYHNSKQEKYLTAAKQIGDFILTLKGRSDGFTGGYEGAEGHETRQTYLSTEHNIDLIAAYSMLYKLTGAGKYQAAAADAKRFVLSMYDSQKKCFYTGTAGDGVTINREVLPLDCNTWALLALKDDFDEAKEVLNFVEQNMCVSNSGYDFNSDRDGIWYEGTAQVALAYLHTGNGKKYDEIITYLNASDQQNGSIYAANKDNITTGFTVSGTTSAWLYSRRVHLGATAWLAFAQLGKNPFDTEKFKK
jgi:hypothetical protein